MDGPYLIMNKQTAEKVAEVINEGRGPNLGAGPINGVDVFLKNQIAGRPLQDGEVVFVGDAEVLQNIVEDNVGKAIWDYIREGDGQDALQMWDCWSEEIEETLERVEQLMDVERETESMTWGDVDPFEEMPFIPYCFYCGSEVNVDESFPIFFERMGEARPVHEDCSPFEAYMQCQEDDCGWTNVNPVTTPVNPETDLRCEMCDSKNCQVRLER